MESKVKILIADESRDFRRICREKLLQLGYREVIEATNGEEALARIGTDRPDIVLLDIWLRLRRDVRRCRRQPCARPL